MFVLVLSLAFYHTLALSRQGTAGTLAGDGEKLGRSAYVVLFGWRKSLRGFRGGRVEVGEGDEKNKSKDMEEEAKGKGEF